MRDIKRWLFAVLVLPAGLTVLLAGCQQPAEEQPPKPPPADQGHPVSSGTQGAPNVQTPKAD